MKDVAWREQGFHPVTMSWKAMFALLAAMLLFASAALADEHSDHDAQSYDATHAAPAERELLGRLVAPCCWNQTLDIHGGAAPDKLRAEIRTRLHAGESSEVIEADFVRRYGPAVLAGSTSKGLAWTSIAVLALSALAATMLILTIRRWLRSGRKNAALGPAGRAPPPDAWDARIDDELRALD